MTLIALASINLAAYCLYWLDKQAARRNDWRVSERMLLTVAVAGGSLGALAACYVHRHKTRKEPFRTLLLAIVTFHVGLVVATILTDPELPSLLDGWAAIS
ncbi:DUF1294 domain-containing protein [Sinorhizobium mexicanum]|uniref:DUF1294 domain-containing protein n=1 Tax=Sinorhizobium mexicanum TaxID=375549 RepID=A0A859QJC4_9HYPH|nr:DUF1294 domain-containing protein [Sinorhizobium mexicanum]MBP1882610.1 uncharacterized membrane protein YsdA (DUF1294 family) [Sinorhizobium mexicanum]QLL61227.1 DUF1294 domain-containing protein [Sinorhizobium mexicanum]